MLACALTARPRFGETFQVPRMHMHGFCFFFQCMYLKHFSRRNVQRWYSQSAMWVIPFLAEEDSAPVDDVPTSSEGALLWKVKQIDETSAHWAWRFPLANLNKEERVCMGHIFDLWVAPSQHQEQVLYVRS